MKCSAVRVFLTVHGYVLVFALVASLTTISFVRSVPLGEGNDETNHVVRVASLLDGQLFGQRRTAIEGDEGTRLMEAGFVISRTYLEAMQYRPRGPDGRPEPISHAEIVGQDNLTWSGDTDFAEAPNTVLYPPLLYIPAALGVRAGQLVHLGPVAAIKLGRLFNAMFYALIGSAALIVATRGRLVILTFLLTPMSLFLASCIGLDGPIIALAALASAALGRPPEMARSVVLHWTGIVCLSLIVITKPPYMPLVGLVWLAARRLPSLQWRDGLAVVLMIALPVLWAGLAGYKSAVPFGLGPYQPGPLWTGAPNAIFQSTDPAAQITVLLADPLRVLTLPVRTFVADFDLLCREVVGVLSWRDLHLPAWLYTVWYGVILAMVVADATPVRDVGAAQQQRQSWQRAIRDGMFVFVCQASALFFIYLALYVSWTAVGYPLVTGVQGRYWVPVLLFIPLVLPWRTQPEPWLLKRALMVPLALAAIDCAVLTSIVIGRYFPQ